MKLLRGLFIFMIIIFCATPLLFSQQDKMRIAIMDLTAIGVSADTAKTVSDLLRTELFNTSLFRVLERAEMDKILKEQGFQQSGCAEMECAVQFGKILSASKVLVGSVNKLGDSFVINARIVDVERGEVEFADNTMVQSESQLFTGCKEFAIKLANRIRGISTTDNQNGMTVNVPEEHAPSVKVEKTEEMIEISRLLKVKSGLETHSTDIRNISEKLTVDQREFVFEKNAKMNSAIKPFLLNIFPFGIGSFVQGDKKSGRTILVIQSVGLVSVVFGNFWRTYVWRLNGENEQDSIFGEGFFYSGLGIMCVGEIIGFIAPWVYASKYDKKLKETLNLSLNVNFNSIGLSYRFN